MENNEARASTNTEMQKSLNSPIYDMPKIAKQDLSNAGNPTIGSDTMLEDIRMLREALKTCKSERGFWNNEMQFNYDKVKDELTKTAKYEKE